MSVNWGDINKEIFFEIVSLADHKEMLAMRVKK